MITSLLPQPFVRGAASLAVSAITLILTCFSPTQAVAAGPVWRTAKGSFVYRPPVYQDCYTDLGTFGTTRVLREDLNFEYIEDVPGEGIAGGSGTDINFLFLYPNGTFNSYANEVYNNCTIGGRYGGFTAQYVIEGGYDGFYTQDPPPPAGCMTEIPFAFEYVGWVVLRGTPGTDLAGLRGYGTFQYDFYGSGVGTYTYYYYFKY